MFIQLPGPEGQPAWFNSDYIVGIYPAGHDPAKTVLVFHDGRHVTVDRDCQKIIRQITVTERPQFPFPLPSSKTRLHPNRPVM